ncbi:unnamed protein product [Calicophoron daubneyi]|uniref:MARVEL domain-containing protein n=1 Tax=Calicophoron daubneyi TaxID=300641 RepID=A0AAV2TJ33_CALDB
MADDTPTEDKKGKKEKKKKAPRQWSDPDAHNTPLSIILTLNLTLTAVFSIVLLATERTLVDKVLTLVLIVIGFVATLAILIMHLLLYCTCKDKRFRFLLSNFILEIVAAICFIIAAAYWYAGGTPNFGAWLLTAVMLVAIAFVMECFSLCAH